MLQKNEAIKTLSTLLTGKKQLLDKVVDLTKHQEEAIKNQNVDKLNQLIEDKQGVINRIDKIDEGFLRQLEAIKNQYQIKDLSEINADKGLLTQLKLATSDVQNLLETIYEVEARNNERIKKDFAEVKSKLKSIKKGKKVASGYYKKSAQTDGYFIDKKK